MNQAIGKRLALRWHAGLIATTTVSENMPGKSIRM